MLFPFRISSRDSKTRARNAVISTAHGFFETPAFLPVGTAASVKGVTPQQFKALGVQAILANTYHLHLRPGEETIGKCGGLHKFMGWDGPIVTDSGGFQVFSLAQTRKLDDDGVIFKSHLDGKEIQLTPEIAIDIQATLGSDIAMPLDECPAQPCGPTALRDAVERTIRWAERCKRHHDRNKRGKTASQSLFGIVQGGVDAKLREECAKALVAMDFDGYSIGGVAVGESKEDMQRGVDFAIAHLPENKPRYLMGVGTPEDILMAVERGVDFFDCVGPTRNARNALVYTSEGKIKLRNAAWTEWRGPLDKNCDCPTCQIFPRAYLRHLFMADEMLGPILATVHNLRFFARLMEEIRASIAAGTFLDTAAKWRAIYPSSPENPQTADDENG